MRIALTEHRMVVMKVVLQRVWVHFIGVPIVVRDVVSVVERGYDSEKP